MGMARIKEKLTASYYSNVIWEILNDMRKHFNECMLVDDFHNARFGLLWPQTDLRGFTQQIRASQQVHLITLPDKWRDTISDNRRYEKNTPLQGGGGRGGRGGADQGDGRKTNRSAVMKSKSATTPHSGKEWNKNSTNINIQYYKIYWLDDLLTAIRKVEFTESGEVTFLTLALGLSLLQLLKQSLEEEARFNAERWACSQPNGTLTYTKAKQFQKGPPTTANIL